MVRRVGMGVALVALAAGVQAAGSDTYKSRCAMCHQADGAGLAGQFPRLNGRVDQIASAPSGRAFLVKVLLYGLYGAITVDGRKIGGVMPPMATLGDQDIADVLNHVVSFDKSAEPVALFTAAEVKAVKAAGRLTNSEVAKERTELAGRGLMP